MIFRAVGEAIWLIARREGSAGYTGSEEHDPQA